MKSRKTSKKIPKLSPSPYKVINEEYKLKDFLFNINKNYDNQINFIEFMNVVSLQFIKNKNQKIKINKHINTHLILDLAKRGELEQNINNMIKTKSQNFSRKSTTEFVAKKDSKIIYQRSPSQIINNFKFIDKNMEKENQNKRVYIGGDEDINIFKEGDFLIINDKKYNINSFSNDFYVEATYLDELIEEKH